MSKENTKNEVEELFAEEGAASNSEEILSLLQENKATNRELLTMIRHINVWVAWQRIFFWLKLILVLISLGIGFLYLPPFIKNSYQQLIDIMTSGAGIN